MRSRDLLLILVQIVGIGGGVLAPQWASVLTPWVLYLMMTILFLSFLRIDYRAVLEVGLREAVEVGLWTAIKLGIMPLGFWAVTRWLFPSYALPVLLLSGVSTGVVAPFLANLLGANTPRVLQVVVVTSLLVPLTLPGWVKLLMGAELHIPFLHMARMLAMVIFVPLVLAAATRRVFPNALEAVNRLQFPISVMLFLSISLGIFSSCSDFLRANAGEVAVAVALSCVLAVLYSGLGLVVARLARGRADGLTGAVCLTFVNNVLIVVFSFRFFDPQAPLLAAMYMLPFFAMLIPLRWVRGSATAGR
jgi:bile acid:Na+ symporter, BASS family